MLIELKTGTYVINVESMEVYKELKQGYTSLLTSKEIEDVREFILGGK